ncbi:hypothetical protein KY285_023748 [Solanum tuberosum]|nr:hypothetical protein KY285_023748 [Solanum tuberosum]
MDGTPPGDRFRPPNPIPVREEAIHTAMAERELDGTRTNVSIGDSSQIHSTRTSEKISQSYELQDAQKLYEFPIPIMRNQQVTVARDGNTGHGVRPTEVSSSFHGGTSGREASGDSTEILATNSGNLISKKEMHHVTQQHNPHREGKQPVQDLGQSSTSNVDDFNQKKDNESGKPPIDNARPNVTPVYNVSTTVFHKIANDQSKAWVAKEQGNLKPVHGNQSKVDNRTNQQQDYNSNFPRISSNFDR